MSARVSAERNFKSLDKFYKAIEMAADTIDDFKDSELYGIRTDPNEIPPTARAGANMINVTQGWYLHHLVD